MKSFSSQTRLNRWNLLEQENTFDLCVIGGGITGAAVARDAQLRGLKTLLVEAQDFASGTSSNSSKLIHGGIRYLENFEFKLVRTAIQERELLKKLYAPFVQDLEFVFPTYKKRTPNRWLLHLGLLLYDSFAAFRVRHQLLNQRETIRKFPLLETQDLTGACVYFDSFAEDYRLVIELIKSAHRSGAEALNYVRVTKAERQSSHWALTLQNHSGETRTIQTKSVMNATGPFSDQVRALFGLPPSLKLTQGIHLIVPRWVLPIDHAYVLSDPQYHRILFAIPWNEITYFGTTDTDIKSVGDAQTQKKDVEYILRIINQNFKTKIQKESIIQSWAGVRPLIQPSETTKSNSQISREHRIDEGPENVFHILGGKLTSHREIALEAVDLLLAKSTRVSPSTTAHTYLQDRPWEKNHARRLERVYGHDAEFVLSFRPELNQRIHPDHPHLFSELAFAIEYEMALKPLDFLRRRSSLYYEIEKEEVVDQSITAFSKAFQWSTEQTQKEKQEVLDQLDWDRRAFRS